MGRPLDIRSLFREETGRELEIDWANPITRDLRATITPNLSPGKCRNHADYRYLTSPSYGLTQVQLRLARNKYPTATALVSNANYYTTFSGLTTSSPVTLLGLVVGTGTTSATVQSKLMDNAGSGFVPVGLHMGDGSNTRIQASWRDSGGTIRYFGSAPETEQVAGEAYFILARVKSGDQRLTVNGVHSSASASVAGTFQYAPNYLTLSQSANISCGFMVCWGRFLSDAEAEHMTVDPMQIFKPTRRTFFFASGSSGATAPGATLTGTASLEAGSATGQADATAPGATLTGTASLTPGTAKANKDIHAVGNGDVLKPSQPASTGSGTVGLAGAAPGATLTGTATLAGGAAQADAQVAGADLTGTASLTAGTAESQSQAAGAELTGTGELAAGQVAADSQAAGVDLTGAGSLQPGAPNVQGIINFTLKNNTGTPLSNALGIIAYVYNFAGALVHTQAGISLNQNGEGSFSSDQITAGDWYSVFFLEMNGSSVGAKRIQAV